MAGNSRPNVFPDEIPHRIFGSHTDRALLLWRVLCLVLCLVSVAGGVVGKDYCVCKILNLAFSNAPRFHMRRLLCPAHFFVP